MQRLLTLLCASLAFSVALMAAAPRAASSSFHDVDGGWHEAWLVVSDLGRMSSFFEIVAGWRERAEGELDAATLAYIAPGAEGGRYRVFAADDYPQGWVRLIELKGTPRGQLRPNAQAWDTGGVFSLMTRSRDAARNLADAERLGWTAYNEPYDFGFGDLKLRNVVLRGPDGVNVAVYEWVAPKRTDAPAAGTLSKSFNAMQMTADLDRALAFYVDTLGYRIVQRGTFVDPMATATNFALPLNLSVTTPRAYAILIPEGGDDSAGRVELMRFQGLQGRDLSGRADLSGVGITTLVFPVADLDALRRRLLEKGVHLVRELTVIRMPPYGAVRALTIKSPDGALLTYVERKDE